MVSVAPGAMVRVSGASTTAGASGLIFTGIGIDVKVVCSASRTRTVQVSDQGASRPAV